MRLPGQAQAPVHRNTSSEIQHSRGCLSIEFDHEYGRRVHGRNHPPEIADKGNGGRQSAAGFERRGDGVSSVQSRLLAKAPRPKGAMERRYVERAAEGANAAD